jgi:putative ABC transport system permease protein
MERDRELAIRTVLGGSRARLISQLLAESGLLGALACGAGILLAYWLRAPLIALSPYQLPGVEQLPFDGRVLAFAVGIGMLTTLLFGLAPALRATEVRLADAIKSSASSITGGRGSMRALSMVAAGEIAVLLALSTGAGLTIESFWKMRYVDVGFRPEHVTAATLNLSSARYRDSARARAFDEQLLRRTRGLPGVESAAITTDLPPGSFRAAANSFWIEGQEFAPGLRPVGRYPAVSAAYFHTMGIPLIRGRLLEESDTETTAPVAVVNQTLARRYFPNGNPIGRRVRANGSEWLTIVGVAGDVKTDGLASSVQPTIYFPYRQIGALGTIEVVMRSPLSADAMAEELRSAVAELDPTQPVSRVQAMDERLSESAASPRFTATFLGAFACLAIVLGIIGVYGVMGCRVRWQLRELAVRHALGAQRRDLSAHVLRQAVAIVAPGLAVGLVASLALGRALSSMLYQMAPNDPATLFSVAAALGVTALAACWIPAMRAARVDPMTALRQD